MAKNLPAMQETLVDPGLGQFHIPGAREADAPRLLAPSAHKALELDYQEAPAL